MVTQRKKYSIGVTFIKIFMSQQRRRIGEKKNKLFYSQIMMMKKKKNTQECEYTNRITSYD